MNHEMSVIDDDKFEDPDKEVEYFEKDNRDFRKKRRYAAEIRRRIEDKMEEKWLRQELGDLDTY